MRESDKQDPGSVEESDEPSQTEPERVCQTSGQSENHEDLETWSAGNPNSIVQRPVGVVEEAQDEHRVPVAGEAEAFVNWDQGFVKKQQPFFPHCQSYESRRHGACNLHGPQLLWGPVGHLDNGKRGMYQSWILYTSSSWASRGRKFQKKKELYSKERICL